MKIINANRNDVTDGLAFHFLQSINSDYTGVIVSVDDGFIFNEKLNELDEYILFDYVEAGWWATLEEIPFFDGKLPKGRFDNAEWNKFADFVISKPPKFYFKRELPKNREGENYLPIEYPSGAEYNTAFSREDFNNRPLEVFCYWGLSHPMRPMFHGNVWEYSHRFGYAVNDNLFYLNGFLKNEETKRKWCSVNIPHYCRMPMKEILNVNGLSKLSVALWGAGRKTFRMAESSVNSVMVMPEDDLQYSFDWVHGVNCLKYDVKEDVIDFLNESLKRTDLYDILLKGVETNKKYFAPNYAKYIEQIIDEKK